MCCLNSIPNISFATTFQVSNENVDHYLHVVLLLGKLAVVKKNIKTVAEQLLSYDYHMGMQYFIIKL